MTSQPARTLCTIACADILLIGLWSRRFSRIVSLALPPLARLQRDQAPHGPHGTGVRHNEGLVVMGPEEDSYISTRKIYVRGPLIVLHRERAGGGSGVKRRRANERGGGKA